MLARGRNAGGNKNWGRKVTCSYRDCATNTKDSDRKMFPFPKPCSAFVHSLIDPSRFEHSVADCERCSKSVRWIQLCGNDGITNLEDVNARTYICVKHFHDGVGPTENCPDPLPALHSSPDSRRGKGRGRRTRRAPSPLVEAMPFVEAVYDEDAVACRIQRAIEHAASLEHSATSHAATDQRHAPNIQSHAPNKQSHAPNIQSHAPNIQSQPNKETHASKPSSHINDATIQACNIRSPAPNLPSPAPSLAALLKASRLETARLARKLSRCQATAKRRLQTIRQLKASAKAAEGGGAEQRKP